VDCDPCELLGARNDGGRSDGFRLDRITATAILLMVAIASISHAGSTFYDPSLAIGHFVGVVILAILPLWLALRIIDFIVGGPSRRRARSKARPDLGRSVRPWV
jgi:hypothetical protein